MTPDDDTTQADAAKAERDAEHERSEARGAELRSELAATDARRAVEETAEAEQAGEEAEAAKEKLSRKEQKARERAEAAEAEADRERAEADDAERKRRETADRAPAGPPNTVSGSSVAAPGLGSGTDPNAAAAAQRSSTAGSFAAGGAGSAGADRPEVLVGAAFAGAFLFARILKRLVD